MSAAECLSSEISNMDTAELNCRRKKKFTG